MIATIGFFNRSLNPHLSFLPQSFSKPSIIYSIPTLHSHPKPPFILKASLPNPQTHFPTPQPPQLLKPLTSLLKTTTIAVITAALFFSASTRHSSAATPIYEEAEAETETETETNPNTYTDEENERIVKEHLTKNPRDIDALTILMEIKIKNQQLPEAITIVDKLIQLSPTTTHWRLLRAHLHTYIGELETARSSFEEILAGDPLSVEAYHGLAMTAKQSESGELENLYKRIENAIELCKQEKRKEDMRDFKLLIAQIKFIEKDYDEALRVYRELAKEEPKDFRPYLYQGIIYTLMRKTSEAKEQFDKYKKLVPKDHPYARYFEDNIISSEAFSEMMQNRILES